MRMPLFPRTWRAALRFSVLALGFVCLVQDRAEAQSCLFGCTVVYATQDTVHGTSCFSLSNSTCSSSNPLTVHVSFGLTVEFFQPNPPPQSFGSHTATSGTCSPGCSGDNFFDTGVLTDNTNPSSNYVTFDGRSTAGGNLNAGTYNYFCAPHGAGMRGIIIVDPDGTTVSLGSTVNPSTYGQTVTFTATVNNSVFFSAVTPTGTVTFFDNGIAISGALTLLSGSRTFTTSTLTGGSHSITAVYTPANGNFSGSTSGILSQTVNAANTSTGTVTLTGGTNPTQAGQLVSFTASVSNTSGTGVVPTGNATFEDNGVAISGAVPLVSGNATFSTSALAGGTHPITAVFNTNSNFNGSTSPSPLNEVVHDFTLSISNPVQSVLPNQTATFNGTLSSFGGYASTITVTCGAGAPAPIAGTCNGASVPLAANAQNVPFTVTASNNAVANFSFNITGSGAESLTRSVPVSLSVGSFSFSQPTPNTVSVAHGNPSSAMAFQISSLGTFSGEVDLSCNPAPPAGVTCMFSNGSATQALFLSAGEVINDTLVLNTTSSASSGTVTVQATPVVAPGQFQTRSVILTETAPAQADTFLYLGTSSNGTTMTSEQLPLLVGVGGLLNFDISAFNQESVTNSTNVNVTLIFAEPISNASWNFTWATGGESCTLVSPIEISCSLATITALAPWIKTITFHVTADTGRTLSFNAILSESNTNNHTLGATVLPGTVNLRYRPMLRPGLKSGSNNPK